MKVFNTPNKKDTEKFYNQLTEGKIERKTLGVDQRFNIDKLMNKKIVRKSFFSAVQKFCHHEKTILLDFGCGPGTFSFLISPHCKQVDGVDISQGFIDAANAYKTKNQYQNTNFLKVDESGDQIPDNFYDVILLVDVIHHLEKIDPIIDLLTKKLKPNGRILVFEPNLLNPVILLMHALDPNEWGLLKLGLKYKYQRILTKRFKNIKFNFNGIVIGPENKIFIFLSNLLNNKFLYPLIGWLNPKVFIEAQKR